MKGRKDQTIVVLYDLIFGDLGCKEIVDLQTYLVEEGLTKISKLRDGHGGGDRQVTKVQDLLLLLLLLFSVSRLLCLVTKKVQESWKKE